MEVHGDAIIKYFKNGFAYPEILEMLKIREGFQLSLSSLKRFLRRNNLFKRPDEHRRENNDVDRQAITVELEGSSRNLGYRRIHRILLTKGIRCRRCDVQKLLKELDPVGVDLRKKRRMRRRKYTTRGPNYVWHIDGHDKLKPYGFSIHGCIDGFSRKLIWLEVGATNKEPDIIARNYLDAVATYGYPKMIKADDGTEHSTIEPLQIALRMLDTDDETALNSFSITTSPQNQRIEAYWSILKRDEIGWWKEFFQDLVDLELYQNSPVLKDCIRFCFMSLLRHDLNSIKNDWNVHLISSSRNKQGPRGRPDTMFYLSHLFDSNNFGTNVDTAELADLYACLDTAPVDVSPEFKEFAAEVLRENKFNSFFHSVKILTQMS